MKILPYSYQHKNQINPNFGTTTRFYKLPNGKEIGNYSWMFRDDIDWKAFARFQTQHFKDKNKVNVIQIGSSDGSEAYTYIISLLESGSKDIEKFFPILGFDLDDKIVNSSLDGYIDLSEKDFKRFNKVGINYHKYFQKTEEPMKLLRNPDFWSLGNYDSYKVNFELKKRVNFMQGEMLNIAERIEDNSDTIVLCRNVMIYCNEYTNKRFIDIIGKNLKEGSILVLGKHDIDLPYVKIFLENANFSRVFNNIYRKLR